MGKHKKLDNRENDLKLFLAIGRQIFNTDDLHFGYWTEDLEVTFQNVPKAQENHSNLIISHIPEETQTILDVGCGVGRMAMRLLTLGYNVDGVSPSTYLAAEARRVLGDEFRIFESRIEDLQTDNRYDLILFSESFQYVQTEKALEACLRLLNDDGYLLICDFFQTDSEGDSPLKAGPRLSRFREIVSKLPFELVEDIDITKETAPTMDLADGLLQNIFRQIWEHLFERLGNKHPRLLKLIKWKFKKKIARIEWRYFNNRWDKKHFEKFKSYRMLLYNKVVTAT